VIDVLLHGIDALMGQGMGLQIGILAAGVQRYLAFKLVEELQHPARGLLGRVQEFHAGLVG
jgi:hypothetical protein